MSVASVATISLGFLATPAYAEKINVLEEDSLMSSLDVLIASHFFLASTDFCGYSWENPFNDVKIVPMYDIEGKISTYYVELPDNAGYAVINNNKKNPDALEFGEGSNPMVREILDRSANPHIIYNSPVSLYDMDEVSVISFDNERSTQDIYANYPDLLESNDGLSDMLSQHKAMLNNADMLMPLNDDGDYGFLSLSQLPHDTYTPGTIPYCNLEWMTTSDFAGKKDNNGNLIKDHCGSVAVSNLALYFGTRGYTNLLKSNNFETFKAVHSYVGNGPVLSITDKAKKYFKDCGYTLNSAPNDSLSSVITAIDNGRPCGFLLENSLFNWHWILVVGYRIGNTSGKTYCTIVDGWNKKANRYYRLNEGSSWISSSEYWMG